MDDVETSTSRTLSIIGRDVCRAARGAQYDGQVTYLTRNGARIAVIMPVPAPGSPVPCWYCNMLVSRDAAGDGIHATNPAIKRPWTYPACDNGHLIHAEQEKRS